MSILRVPGLLQSMLLTRESEAPRFLRGVVRFLAGELKKYEISFSFFVQYLETLSCLIQV